MVSPSLGATFLKLYETEEVLSGMVGGVMKKLTVNGHGKFSMH